MIEHGVLELSMRATPNDDLRRMAKEREESNTCLTAWVDDKIVAVAGIDKLWEGVGEIWFMATPYLVEKPKSGFRCIRDGMAKLIKKHGMRRVQSAGRMDFPQCHILFKHLKFKAEGIMEAYTSDGVDCILYSLIKEQVI